MGTHPIFESDFDCLTDMEFENKSDADWDEIVEPNGSLSSPNPWNGRESLSIQNKNKSDIIEEISNIEKDKSVIEEEILNSDDKMTINCSNIQSEMSSGDGSLSETHFGEVKQRGIRRDLSEFFFNTGLFIPKAFLRKFLLILGMILPFVDYGTDYFNSFNAPARVSYQTEASPTNSDGITNASLAISWAMLINITVT